MYHPTLIAHNRSKLETSTGISLREYSFAEVDEFAYRLRGVDWPEQGTGDIIPGLDEEIQRYIYNEIQMSKLDFRYWCERYCKVIDDKGQLVAVKPWPTQEALLELVAEEELAAFQYAERERKELEAKCAVIILKARQLGGTVISEALLAHLVFLFRFTRAGIASDHILNSLKLWQTFMRMYDHLPQWMKPTFVGKMKAHNLHLDQLDSDVVVGAGNQETTFGQGMTVDTAHLTELSSFEPKNANALDEDLKPAFYSSRKHHSLLIFESTGQGGKGNYFHDQYQAAAKGKSQFKALFLGWFRDPNKWAIRADGVTISERTKNVLEMIKRETGIECSKEQAAWYEVTRSDYEERGKIQQFYQEYPSTPEEAFQSGFNSVFPIELRRDIRAKCKKPLAVFAYSEERRTFVKEDLEGYLESKDPDKADNKLVIWEKPRGGCLYTVGVDVSYGQDGGDSSAIEVMRVGNKWEPDEQVAEWRGTIHPVDLASPVWLLGHMYNDKVENLPAKVAIEVNPGSPGIVTQTELMRRNYTHFYFMTRKAELGKAMMKKIGWHTTTGTRNILTDKGTQAIKSGGLVINSPDFVGEMDSFVVKMNDLGRRKLEHSPNCHDDRIIAMYIAYVIAHESETATSAEDRATAWEMKNRKPEEVVQFQAFSGKPGETLPQLEDMYDEWEEQVFG